MIIRDWRYLYDSRSRFYGMSYDPFQQMDMMTIKHNDKSAPSNKERLEKILKLQSKR